MIHYEMLVPKLSPLFSSVKHTVGVLSHSFSEALMM